MTLTRGLAIAVAVVLALALAVVVILALQGTADFLQGQGELNKHFGE